MSPHDNGSRNYTQFHAQRYVRFLGCWSFVNPTDAAKRRDPNEYRELLLKLIEANKTRDDKIGTWETLAAFEELDNLLLTP